MIKDLFKVTQVFYMKRPEVTKITPNKIQVVEQTQSFT